LYDAGRLEFADIMFEGVMLTVGVSGGFIVEEGGGF
jgi:hypothetical protein